MPINYNRKTEQELVFEDNKDYVRTHVRLAVNKLKRRLENAALAEMEESYKEGLARDEIRELGPSLDELQILVADTARQLILEPGE